MKRRARYGRGTKDAKLLTRLKIVIAGRGRRSRLPLSRRERRLLARHSVLAAVVREAIRVGREP